MAPTPAIQAQDAHAAAAPSAGAVRTGNRGAYLRPSEAKVLQLVLAGHCNKTIARRLQRSTKTVEAQITQMSERFKTKGRQGLQYALMSEAWARHAEPDAPLLMDALREALDTLTRGVDA